MHHDPPRRPAPPPEPDPEPDPRDLVLDALASPELTGMTRADFGALAARLELPAAAAREQRLHLARGRPRHAAPRTPATALSHPARLAATILRHRHNLPYHAIAYLLGVSSDTATTAITPDHQPPRPARRHHPVRHPADRPRRPPRPRSRRGITIPGPPPRNRPAA